MGLAETTMMHSHAACACILAVSPRTASAQSRPVVGVLECRAGAATTFVVGSIRDFDCLFWSVGAAAQRYVATIQRFGVDLGWSGSAALVWHVLAPRRWSVPGRLPAATVGCLPALRSVSVLRPMPWSDAIKRYLKKPEALVAL
jgi:hypothetical protein